MQRDTATDIAHPGSPRRDRDVPCVSKFHDGHDILTRFRKDHHLGQMRKIPPVTAMLLKHLRHGAHLPLTQQITQFLDHSTFSRQLSKISSSTS